MRKSWLDMLLTKKVIVPNKYSDFADVFSKKPANVLPVQIGANEHAIELEKAKQPSYRPIYSLELVQLEIPKTYIEIILMHGFIRALKSPADAPILFIHKPNASFCLCVNYQRLNNLTIKNWYPLPLIGKFLNRLSQAKWLNQLKLTSAYYQIKIKAGDKWKTAFRT